MQVVVVGYSRYYISVLMELIGRIREGEQGPPRPTGERDAAAKGIDVDLKTVAETRKSDKWAAHSNELHAHDLINFIVFGRMSSPTQRDVISLT